MTNSTSSLRILATTKKKLNWLIVLVAWFGQYLRWLHILNPRRYIRILDWYIIKKFIGTYIYSIMLIISISIVFDVNENLA